MSESHGSDRARELGELFVTITGDDTVTEHRKAGQPSKEPRSESETLSAVDDGLADAVDADLDTDVA